MNFVIFIASAALVSSMASNASAQLLLVPIEPEPAPAPARRGAPRMDLTATSQLGASIYADNSAPNGVMASALALYRVGLLGAGLTFGTDAEVLGAARSVLASVVGGLSTRSATGVRFDMLGTLGWHAYWGWGGSGIGEETKYLGATASMPCAGLRLRLAYAFSRQRRAHFQLGFESGLDSDLQTKRALNVNESLVSAPRVESVGSLRVTLGLILGVAIDFGSDSRAPISQ